VGETWPERLARMTSAGASSVDRVKLVRLYALVEAGDPEATDVFIRPEDARRALEACLKDEPEWRGLLRVDLVEVDTEPSQN
jgi:hypothetical protein